MRGEGELERVRTRYQDQIARYRENAEKSISDVQKKNDETVANMKRTRERERERV
jgi:hypothetical protein